MALTFNPLDAARKLRANGMAEATANATVEVVTDATSPLVTVDYLDTRLETLEARLYGSLRAEFYRVSLIQGGVIIGAVVALVKLL